MSVVSHFLAGYLAVLTINKLWNLGVFLNWAINNTIRRDHVRE